MIPSNVMPRGCACTGQCLRGTCPAVSGESAALTLRDHFATHAMAAILGHDTMIGRTIPSGEFGGMTEEQYAVVWSYRIADLMLAERGRSKSKPQISPQVSGSGEQQNIQQSGTNSYGGTE